MKKNIFNNILKIILILTFIFISIRIKQILIETKKIVKNQEEILKK